MDKEDTTGVKIKDATAEHRNQSELNSKFYDRTSTKQWEKIGE